MTPPSNTPTEKRPYQQPEEPCWTCGRSLTEPSHCPNLTHPENGPEVTP